MEEEDADMTQTRKAFYALVGFTFLLIVIVTAFLHDEDDQRNAMLGVALASEGFHLAPQVRQRLPGDRRVNISAPEWSVLKECEEPREVFFIISSEASDWISRADIRDTLLEHRVTKMLRWTGAFFVHESREPLVADWIEVEGQATGDLIMLPSGRTGSARAFNEFHVAVRWVMEHCAKVRYVIKIKTNVMVHPTGLYRFLRRMDRNGLDAVLCDMRGSSRLHPDTEVAVSVAKSKFFVGAYQLYCAGSVTMASLKMLRDLDRAMAPLEPGKVAVHKLPLRQNEDASLQIKHVAVGGISHISLDSGWDCTFVKLKRTSVRRLDRYASWYFAVWKDLVWNKPRFKNLLSGPRHKNSTLWKQLDS
ncbi:hypothetical protein HPB50_018950 [Hyalomma asiaticum]|uniref:Uncharacterized protein n=1 Tax=Hyalomma asiaticum TaxID=266040 RepID=A0ACB7RUC2_HYAAI|nr:hypothetical protein HPB50_018950 [Hyalomma asiaticum]